MILLIDNYDSFTFNLYQIMRELGVDVTVVRNDQVMVDELEGMLPEIERIVISPGPGTPKDAGISVSLVKRFAGQRPILGVCLGHQSIGVAFGGRVIRAPSLMHGKTSLIHHKETGIFAGLPNPFVATRYHSLTIERETLPRVLEITAESDDGVIMSFRHRELEIDGVQFHPESILTVTGRDLLANFLGLRETVVMEERVPAAIGY